MYFVRFTVEGSRAEGKASVAERGVGAAEVVMGGEMEAGCLRVSEWSMMEDVSCNAEMSSTGGEREEGREWLSDDAVLRASALLL